MIVVVVFVIVVFVYLKLFGLIFEDNLMVSVFEKIELYFLENFFK